MSLTDKIARTIANPAKDDAFDPHVELADLLAGVGMNPADTGGAITFAGADPVVPSTLRLGEHRRSRWSPNRRRWRSCGDCVAGKARTSRPICG